jgi:hypothetical protein
MIKMLIASVFVIINFLLLRVNSFKDSYMEPTVNETEPFKIHPEGNVRMILCSNLTCINISTHLKKLMGDGSKAMNSIFDSLK